MSGHLGIDIGGTKVQAVVTDASGAVLGEHRTDTGRGSDAVLAAALAAADGALAIAGKAIADVATVGVGVPGTVRDGVVRHAVNLGVEELDIGRELESHWGLSPAVENDVNAAAMGAWALTGGGKRSLAYLNLGTGLAAGIVLEGRLWRGGRGAAGEIGHISVDPAGPSGPDGLPGGLEAYAGGAGIALAAGDGRTAEQILADPDGGARRVLAFGVASAIRILILTFDVEEVVVGGGIARSGDALAEGVRTQLEQWAAGSRFLNSVDLPGRFRLLLADEPVAAIGAAMAGMDRG